MTEVVEETGIPLDDLGGIEQMKVVDRINLRLLQEIYLALRGTREALEARAGAKGATQ